MDPESVDTLLLCSGRVTWDLMVARGKRDDRGRFAIARVEQLYPLPVEELKAEIAKYPNLKAVRWVQDEPENMGPWPHFAMFLTPQLDVKIEPITRAASSSPSVGTVKRHAEEQQTLLGRAFAEVAQQPRHDY